MGSGDVVLVPPGTVPVLDRVVHPANLRLDDRREVARSDSASGIVDGSFTDAFVADVSRAKPAS
jgi:hypothetical protein